MPPEQRYRMLGREVVIRVDDEDLRRAIDRLLAWFGTAKPPTGRAHRYSVTSSGALPEYCLNEDDALILRSPSWPGLINGLLGELNRLAIDGFRGLAVHAGAVAGRDGVVAFPAVSEAGKSTLTAACLKVGFGYVSDEALCVDFDRAAVIAYPRPMMLSNYAREMAGLATSPNAREAPDDRTPVLPEELAASVVEGEVGLSHVVRLLRRPGEPVLVPIDRSETVAALLSLSFNHYRQPLACFRLATRLAAEARAWQLEFDDPRPAAELLMRKIGR